MATTQTNNEKEWKGLKLTSITEEVDGTNNYGEFKQKSQLDLDAAGYYWQYVGGPDYKPPTIPKLRSSVQVQGVNGTGETVAVTVPGNETEVAAAKKKAEAWLLADKKHSRNEYEPANALTTVTIKQQIISYQCDSSENPVRWREVMIHLNLLNAAICGRHSVISPVFFHMVQLVEWMGTPRTSMWAIQILPEKIGH